MPMLFISYKRGDSAAEPIAQRLRAAKYRIWFDNEAIVAGQNSKDSIHTGIEQSDALIAILNLEAFDSPYVAEEIKLALEKKKLIIPLLTHPAATSKLNTFGIDHLQVIDFTISGHWEDSMTKLLKDLQRNGIKVTQHRPYQIDSEKQLDYQEYFGKLRKRIGFLNLSRIVLDGNNVPLERIYVPLPIEFTLSITVKQERIVQWWLNRVSDISKLSPNQEFHKMQIKEIFAQTANVASLDIRLGLIQDAIDRGADSEYDLPQLRPLVLAPPWYSGNKLGFWPLETIDAAAISNRLVILGPPGSGKTTVVRHLALCLLGENSDPKLSDACLSTIEVWPHGPMVPIYIELRQFVEWCDLTVKLEEPFTAEHFWKYVREKLLGSELAGLAHDLRNDLLGGNVVIILDGLDEVPIPQKDNAPNLRRKQVKELASSLGTIYPLSRIIFTSRTNGYTGWELEGFTPITLSALSRKKMKNLAINLYNARNMGHEEAVTKANALMKALENVPHSLKDYPLFLTLMATLFLYEDAGGLPTKKGDLYYQSIMLLLDRWTQPRLGDSSLVEQIGCNVDSLYERLENIAYETQKKRTYADNPDVSDELDRDTSDGIDVGLILKELFKLGPGADLHRLLPYLSQQSGVLVAPKEDTYQFAHRSYQEYLTASYVARNSSFGLIRDAIEKQTRFWRETCLLVGDVLTQKGSTDKLWNLVDVLLDDELNSDSENKNRWWSIWLAARLVVEQEMYLPPIARRNDTVYKNLRYWLKKLLETSDALLPKERADVGKCLGLIGDDRPGVNLKDGKPDILWCTIPDGKFLMGTTEEQIQEMKSTNWATGWTFNRETPSDHVPLPEFQISCYPITNKQFQQFIADPNGYSQDNWWTPNGRLWKVESGGPIESGWDNIQNFPRTNVSWYEAMAFCEWLSDRLGYKVKLPTEAQWEKAARGNDGRIFPWGNQFDPNKCNMDQTKIGQPCAVGCFITPELPWGNESPLDMSGNIWEWCTTICEEVGKAPIPYPYKPDERENTLLDDNHLRVVRGGSFLNSPFLVRTAFRGRDKPTGRYLRQGFRIVRSREK